MKTSSFSSVLQDVLIGAQMLFVAFGSLVLVPLLTGLDPNVALFTAGLGTLLFQFFTKGKVPVFLASSFAFIAPITFSIQQWGIPATLGGLIGAGCCFIFISGLIKWRGLKIVNDLLPPVVTGPIIMVIGLALAPTAVNMALGQQVEGLPLHDAMIISMITLLTTLIVAIWAKGLFRLIPIISGIFVGYIVAYFYGLVDFMPIKDAAWLARPHFQTPEFNWQVILFMLPVVIAPTIEHIGDIIAIGTISGKDYVRDPGLHRTLLGDGAATIAAGCFGGPPCITYAEVIGAVTLTQNFKVRIMTFAAVWAIIMSFIGKVGAFLHSIPTVVMGGIMVLLFGSIASVGMNILIKHHVNLSQPRNMCIVSLVLIFGIGGMVFEFGAYSLKGISLCGLVAIILNLILPKETNKTESSS